MPSPVPTSGMVDRQVASEPKLKSFLSADWELSLESDDNIFLGDSFVQREVFIDYHFLEGARLMKQGFLYEFNCIKDNVVEEWRVV